jgi:hypothetical protein
MYSQHLLATNDGLWRRRRRCVIASSRSTYHVCSICIYHVCSICIYTRVIAHMHTHMCISRRSRRHTIHTIRVSYVYIHASSRAYTRHHPHAYARVHIMHMSSSRSTYHVCSIYIYVRAVTCMHVSSHIYTCNTCTRT